MKPSHIYAIIRKQLKDTFRNKPTLVQFVMFPAIAAILTLSAGEFELPKRYFVNLFSVMYVCMAPILILSAIISEEKEKGSLRMLMMSNVKPMEYLLGIGAYVFVFCMAGVLFMGLLGKYSLQELWMFLLLNACGILISSVIGGLIGVVSDNQTAASGLSVPAMLLTSFIPMLSMFNASIRNVGKFLYSQQIYEQINNSSTIVLSAQSFVVVLINFALVLVLYVYMYRKKQLLAS